MSKVIVHCSHANRSLAHPTSGCPSQFHQGFASPRNSPYNVISYYCQCQTHKFSVKAGRVYQIRSLQADLSTSLATQLEGEVMLEAYCTSPVTPVLHDSRAGHSPIQQRLVGQRVAVGGPDWVSRGFRQTALLSHPRSILWEFFIHRASGGGNSNPQPAKRPRANRAKRSCGGYEDCYDSVTRHASQQDMDHRRVITLLPRPRSLSPAASRRAQQS